MLVAPPDSQGPEGHVMRERHEFMARHGAASEWVLFTTLSQ